MKSGNPIRRGFGLALLASTALTAPAALAKEPQVNFAFANSIQADFSAYFGRVWEKPISDGPNYDFEERGISGRVNLPFGGVVNLELEAGAKSRSPLGDEEVSAFAHLYWRDPSRFAVGIFGGTSNPYFSRFTSFGGEAQLYLGNLILYAQGAWGTAGGNFSDRPDRMLQARGNVKWFPTPGTSIAADASFTRFSEIFGSDLNVGAVALTATQQLWNSPLALFLEGRYEHNDYSEFTLGGNTYLARAGIRLLLGPAGTNLWTIATTGPAMDVVNLTPVVIRRPSCFTGGTQILMADGTLRPIAEVRVGDDVLGENGEVNRVVEIETPLLGDRKLHGFNGGEAFVTIEHPFKTREGWQSLDPAATFEETRALEVTLLRPGAECVTLAGVFAERVKLRASAGGRAAAPMLVMLVETAFTRVETIEAVTADPATQVYNLRLADNHTYFANGWLVHNR